MRRQGCVWRGGSHPEKGTSAKSSNYDGVRPNEHAHELGEAILYPVREFETARLWLRQPVEADIPSRLEIPRDPEENRMYGGDGAPKTFSPDEVRGRLSALAAQNSDVARSWVMAAKVWPDGRVVSQPAGRYIGQITIFDIDADHRNARLRMGIYDRRFWSHGYGREAIRRVLEHMFDDIGLHRVALRVAAYNVRAIRSYESCGFVVEGRERESIWLDGQWWDDLWMGILASELKGN